MRLFKNLEEAYGYCLSEGEVNSRQEIDEDIIKVCLNIAEEDLLSAKDAIVKKRWNSAYKLYYDVIHQLAEAFIHLDGIKIKTHLCLFVYLCIKHPELDFDWDFFERIRTKRNGINYYGTPVSFNDWKEVELQFNLYIQKLKEEIKNKLF